MGRTVAVTVTLPEGLVSFVDQIARERKINRSKVIAACLHELAEKQRIANMAQGYQAMAKEQGQFAALVSGIEHEVAPEWK